VNVKTKEFVGWENIINKEKLNITPITKITHLDEIIVKEDHNQIYTAK